MSERNDHDGVDLLTEGMGAERAEFARRLTTAMRLMAADASGESTPSAAVHPASAALELSTRRVKRALVGLDAIARHLLRAALPDGSFLQVDRPERGLGYTDAWRRLLRTLEPDERERLGVRIPAPGVAPGEALGDVLRAMGALASDAPGSAGSRRLERLALLSEAHGAPALGESARACEDFAQRLHGGPDGQSAATRALRRDVLLDAIALSMDAGRARDLGALLERVEEPPRDVASCRSAGDALALLAAWVRGWEDGARFPRIADDRADELGLRVGAWREVEALVDGDAGGARFALAAPSDAHAPGALDRRAVGARAVVVCRIDAASGRVAVVASDCAPGVRDAVPRWASRRRDALRERGAPEHEVARRACALGWSAASGDDGVRRVLAEACLGGGGAGAAALSVLPLLDDAGEAHGLVWVESEHVLPPGPDARAALVAAGQVLVGRPLATLGPCEARPASSGPERDVDARLAGAWERAVEGLQLKLAERRWVAFQPGADLDDGRGGRGPVAVAAGGDGALGALDGSGGRIVERAFRTGGTVRRGSEGVFERAHAGAAIPLRLGRTVIAVLCIESSRRGDVREVDIERWDAALAAAAPDVAVATADARDRGAGHGGITLAPREPGAALPVRRLVALVEARSHLCVMGEAGSGRASIARLVAHASRLGGGGGRARVLSGRALASGADDPALGAAPEDVVVLRDVDTVPAEAVDRVRALVAPGGPRVLMTAVGSRAPALARAVGAACVRLDALRARRTDIVPIARAMLARHTGPGLDPGLDLGPALAEDAEAMLWRQPWPGHCEDLASVLSTAAVLAGGAEPIGAAAIAAALTDSGLEPLHRLPSRDPDPRDVAAAVAWTRTATGRINKARASTHLGWDPGTLAARLDDLGIGSLADAERVLDGDAPKP